MKKLFLLPLFVFGAMAVNAQVQTNTTGAPTASGMQRENGPVMTFEVMEYNFGTIKQGESVSREFKFKNTGKEPLIINNAQGSCGCTVPEYPKEPIKPNGEGVIKVTFNSAGKMGMQDKTVTITYDTDKTIVLHMKGTVEAAAAAPANNNNSTPSNTPNGTTTPTPAPKTQPGAAPKSPAPAKTPAPKQVAAPGKGNGN
jgi:hypothetical protein